jgi:hypothetical protein
MPYSPPTLRETATNLGKSLACLGAGLVWVWIALHYVSDTPIGATVVLGPFLLAFIPSVYFFARARGFGKRDDETAP